MLHQLLLESGGHFWQSEEFENVANQDFGNLKRLQNPRYLFLTAPIVCLLIICVFKDRQHCCYYTEGVKILHLMRSQELEYQKFY